MSWRIDFVDPPKLLFGAEVYVWILFQSVTPFVIVQPFQKWKMSIHYFNLFTLYSRLSFLRHSKERYRCTSHWRVWAISIIHFLFSKNFVKLWTKSMMGKYDEHVLRWKFVNVIFKGCCHERHLLKIKNYSMPFLLNVLRDMIPSNTVNRYIISNTRFNSNCWLILL